MATGRGQATVWTESLRCRREYGVLHVKSDHTEVAILGGQSMALGLNFDLAPHCIRYLK